MIRNPLQFEVDHFDMTSPFNIGQACTCPDVDGFDPEQQAIIVDAGNDQATCLSYDQLNRFSNQFARVLESAGIGKGDRVMLWLPNVVEFPIGFFGALKLGAIAVPASVMLTAEEVNFLLQNARARVLVTTESLYGRLEDDLADRSDLDLVLIVDGSFVADSSDARLRSFHSELEMQPAADLPCVTTAEDPAYLVYTSGTTGYPKGVLHAHRALLGRLPAARYWFDYDESRNDRILHSGKFNWTYVLGTALMDPLFLGKTVIVHEGDSRPSVWPELIARHSATIFIGVPTIYRQILQKTHFTCDDVPTLRHCMCAGEHLSEELFEAWQQRFGQTIYEAIGMSECSYYLSQHPGRAVKPGSAGFVQPGHRVYLLDEHFEEVADNEEGMLCVRLDDPGLFIEYWELPEETAASRKNGYFLTGDYARRDQDGYFWFLGRKDDIINSFGYRISPMEIERVLKSHPDVADCVAVEQTVGQDKNIVTACVIVNDQAQLTEPDLIEFAGQHLARYKVPKRVVFYEQFPRTANGKVIRKRLRASL